MPRHESAYDLTNAEKRDLIKLIEQGRPLPEKYRFLLFADKREVELVWNGKSREVCTAILPFQTLEHIDEPRKEKRDDEELGLDTGGRQVKGWTNKLIWGDNKLIYIDPPFDVGADFSMDIEIGGETFHKEPNLTGNAKAQALARKQQEFRDLILRAYRAEPLGGGGFASGRVGVPPAVPGVPPGTPEREETSAAKGRRKTSEGSRETREPAGGTPTLPETRQRGTDEFFHGKTGNRLVVVGPINLPVGRLFIEEVITECRKRGASRVDVLAFEFEMGLFAAVLDEAKQKGIDLAPKTIPPEVFDKRAVEKGQVRFHDVAYIEVTPRFDVVAGNADPGHGSKLTLAVELPDFSVYYSQDISEALTAELKAGIFENEWQSFRTRQSRDLELTAVSHTYSKPGRYTIAVKVIDIFGNDTITLVQVTAG